MDLACVDLEQSVTFAKITLLEGHASEHYPLCSEKREYPLIMKKLIIKMRGSEGLVAAMTDCKYCQDEICVNSECPMCADFCPVVDFPGVCRFEEREEAQNGKQS